MMADRDVTAARALSSEAVKLATLPVMWLCTLGTICVATAVAVALHSNTHQLAPAETILRQVTGYAMVGTIVGAVCATTSEYGTRQVSRSLGSVPSRPLLLGAKALAIACWAAFTSLLSLVIALALGAGPSDPGLWRVLATATLHMVSMALVAAALGMLLRGLVASLASALVLLVVVPPLASAATPLARWLPSLASERLMDTAAPATTLSAAALAVAAWAAGLWGCAATRFVNGDA